MQGLSQVEWSAAVIQALGRLRKEQLELEAILGYILRSRPAWAT